jgi:hypothetical protein
MQNSIKMATIVHDACMHAHRLLTCGQLLLQPSVLLLLLLSQCIQLQPQCLQRCLHWHTCRGARMHVPFSSRGLAVLRRCFHQGSKPFMRHCITSIDLDLHEVLRGRILLAEIQ